MMWIAAVFLPSFHFDENMSHSRCFLREKTVMLLTIGSANFIIKIKTGIPGF